MVKISPLNVNGIAHGANNDKLIGRDSQSNDKDCPIDHPKNDEDSFLYSVGDIICPSHAIIDLRSDPSGVTLATKILDSFSSQEAARVVQEESFTTSESKIWEDNSLVCGYNSQLPSVESYDYDTSDTSTTNSRSSSSSESSEANKSEWPFDERTLRSFRQKGDDTSSWLDRSVDLYFDDEYSSYSMDITEASDSRYTADSTIRQNNISRKKYHVTGMKLFLSGGKQSINHTCQRTQGSRRAYKGDIESLPTVVECDNSGERKFATPSGTETILTYIPRRERSYKSRRCISIKSTCCLLLIGVMVASILVCITEWEDIRLWIAHTFPITPDAQDGSDSDVPPLQLDKGSNSPTPSITNQAPTLQPSSLSTELVASAVPAGNSTLRDQPSMALTSTLPPSICENVLSIDENCYSGRRPKITVIITQCDPMEDDWIGIYKADADPQALDDDSVEWSWACGDQLCRGRVSQSVVNFSVRTPETGNYRVFLLRDSSLGPPYVSYASSEVFTISHTCP